MQHHIHTIVKHFFQKDSLQEVSEQTLRQFTEEHPYSSVGQWLLAKKVHDSAPDRAGGQAADAVAWFNNPLWLHWTLQEHEPVAETLFIPSKKEETVTIRYSDKPEPATAGPIAEPAPASPVDAAIEPVEAPLPPSAPAIAESVVAETETEETEIYIPGVSSPVSLVDEPAIADPITGIAPEEEKTIEVVDIDIIEEVYEASDEGPAITPEPETAIADTAWPAEEAALPVVVETSQPVETPEIPVEEPVAAPQPVENVQEIPASGTSIPPVAPLLGIASLMEAFKPVPVDNEEPVFEPYHTIDYFASLGVKLRQEDLKDKLGIQLKSFTEWLRGMKRLPATAIPEENTQQFDDQLQQAIQVIAGHSVEGKEVVTEAMAEVWVKQGSKQKAIAIYEKLSLQNPAKSPYFATRIEQIKAL